MVGLDLDLPGPAESVEVVDIGGAQIGLERAEDFVQRDPERLRLGTVDLGEELRHVGTEGRVEVGESRLRVAVGDDLLRRLAELVQPDAAAVLKLELEAAGDPKSADRWRREGENDGLLDGEELALQICQNLRRNAEYQDTVLIALLPDEENPNGFDRSSITELFKRPFDPALLAERIRTLVNRKKDLD